MMTLNDNPLVDCEKRFKLLHKRKDGLCAYISSRLSFRCENGVATGIAINPHIKVDKARRLLRIVNKEISKHQKLIRRHL